MINSVPSYQTATDVEAGLTKRLDNILSDLTNTLILAHNVQDGIKPTQGAPAVNNPPPPTPNPNNIYGLVNLIDIRSNELRCALNQIQTSL